MKPNFALNLSPDGIGLLHRAAGGWHSVGEAKLDDPALDETLAYLRRTAAGLDARGIATKLIIPPSQVLYISLHAPGPSDEERQHQIRAALKGLTPSAVEDIVLDSQAQGDEDPVAAVAHETLAEP